MRNRGVNYPRGDDPPSACDGCSRCAAGMEGRSAAGWRRSGAPLPLLACGCYGGEGGGTPRPAPFTLLPPHVLPWSTRSLPLLHPSKSASPPLLRATRGNFRRPPTCGVTASARLGSGCSSYLSLAAPISLHFLKVVELLGTCAVSVATQQTHTEFFYYETKQIVIKLAKSSRNNFLLPSPVLRPF